MINYNLILFSMILLILLLLITRKFLNKYPELIFLLLFFYTQYTGFTSSLVVEHGIYITEIGQALKFKFASLSLIFFLILPFILSYLFFKKSKKSKIKQVKFPSVDKLFLHLILLILIVLILNILISPNPIFDNVRRFDFWETAKIPILKNIFGTLSIPIPIGLSIIYIKFKLSIKQSLYYKFLIIISFLLYLFYLYGSGQKFNGFVIAIIFTIIPFIYLRKINYNFFLTKKEITYLILFIFILLFYKYYEFSVSAGGVIDEVNGNPFLAVLYRMFVLQGYSYVHYFNNGYELNTCIEDISFMHCAIKQITVHPNFYLDNNINLANIFPGFLLQFNYGFLLVFLAILFFSAISFLMIKISRNSLLSGNTIEYILSTQILFWLIGSFPSGNYQVLYSPKMLFFIILLLLIYSLKKSKIFLKRKKYETHLSITK